MTQPDTPPPPTFASPPAPPQLPPPSTPVAQLPAPDLGADAPLPAPVPVLAALYRLFLRTTATRGRLLAIGALSGLSLLSAVIASATGPTDSFEAAASFAVANLTTLLPVAALVFGSGSIGDLIDDGSLVYVWLRPLSTRLPVVAAWAATMTILIPLVGLPIMAGTAMLDTHPDILGATSLALLVGIPAYSALAVMAGIRFRRALPWGLAYILLWEGFVAGGG